MYSGKKENIPTRFSREYLQFFLKTFRAKFNNYLEIAVVSSLIWAFIGMF